MKYVVWALILPFEIVIGLIGKALAPIICLFIERKPRTDVVKRLGKATVTLDRDHLIPILWWFDTFDNATDEYWYGMYDNTPNYTQSYYDTHTLYRYFCRVMWLQRNSMYGFTRAYISIEPDSWLAWKYKGNVPIGFGFQMHINVGWKAHKGYRRLMFAGRPLGRITKK